MIHQSVQTEPPRKNSGLDSTRGPRIDQRAFSYYGRLRRLREHLEAHINQPLSATQAARIAGVSESYFSTFFHERVGVRYTIWTRTVRIERALEILRTTNTSITQVAGLVGFNDLRTFERAFRKLVGMTPREFKKRSRPTRTEP